MYFESEKLFNNKKTMCNCESTLFVNYFQLFFMFAAQQLDDGGEIKLCNASNSLKPQRKRRNFHYETFQSFASLKFLVFVLLLLLFFGSSRIQRPPRALNVILNKGSNVVFPATGKTLKCLSIVEITVFISSIANLWPILKRGEKSS